jgi:hypothetical protein
MTNEERAGVELRPADPPATGAPGDVLMDASSQSYTVPDHLMGIAALKANASQLSLLIGEWSPQHMFTASVEGKDIYFFRTDPSDERLTGSGLPQGIQLYQSGDVVLLPKEHHEQLLLKLDSIAFVPLDEVKRGLGLRPPLQPEVVNNPLLPFSLRGSAAEFEQRAVSARFLLGTTCLSGQMTIWFAPPNAGKTLILLKMLEDAIDQGLINPANVFYVNADDSSEGFAEKMRLMDDRGVHTLAPGHKGLTSAGLVQQIASMAHSGKAQGVLIILDTVKKFASLMDKARAAAFADVCRRFVMQGGTIVGLAHTNKNPGADGTLRYAGTSDLVDDSDAAYIITPRTISGAAGDRVAEFRAIKRRGKNAERIAYAFAGDGDISYAERLASVRVVDPDTLDAFQQQEADRADADLITVAEACITDGITAKMELAKAVAKRASISERKAVQLIERYTGENPAQHKWTYTVKARGAKVFALLPAPATDPVPEGPHPA